MNKFKAGDKVYYPQAGHTILEVQKHPILEYALKIYLDDGTAETFIEDGKQYRTDKAASIFHATPEKQKQLEALHGIKLEDAPVKPTSREIIKAKLNKSTEPVPCWVSNNSDRAQPTRKDVWAFIQEVDTDPSPEFPFLAATGNWWMHATPFDRATLQPITELPKGEYYE